MHDDVRIHLDHFHRGDGCVSITLSLSRPRGRPGAIHTDVVELAVLLDHFDTWLADVVDGDLHRSPQVFGPLKTHDALWWQMKEGGESQRIMSVKAF